jgi:hypothetical protein
VGLFLLHLGNCITTVNVPQASSPITVKFDACLTIPSGNPKNQCYIQDLEIYMCIWPSPLIPIEIIAVANMTILRVLVGVMWGGQQTWKRVLHRWLHVV